MVCCADVAGTFQRRRVRNVADFIRLLAAERRNGGVDGRAECAGGDRSRDQDRPDDALYRPGRLGLVARSGREGLHANDQRSGRHQRPQDQPDQRRRRLSAVADRDGDAQADRSRPRRLYVRVAWNDHAARGRKISQRAKNPPAVHRERRLPLGQLQGDTLYDRRRAPELSAGSASLRPVHTAAGSKRKNLHPLRGQRLRPRLCSRACATCWATNTPRP